MNEKKSKKYEKWHFCENVVSNNLHFHQHFPNTPKNYFFFLWNQEIMCTIFFNPSIGRALCVWPFFSLDKMILLALSIGKSWLFLRGGGIMAVQNDAETPKVHVIPFKPKFSDFSEHYRLLTSIFSILYYLTFKIWKAPVKPIFGQFTSGFSQRTRKSIENKMALKTWKKVFGELGKMSNSSSYIGSRTWSSETLSETRCEWRHIALFLFKNPRTFKNSALSPPPI